MEEKDILSRWPTGREMVILKALDTKFWAETAPEILIPPWPTRAPVGDGACADFAPARFAFLYARSSRLSELSNRAALPLGAWLGRSATSSVPLYLALRVDLHIAVGDIATVLPLEKTVEGS